MTRYLFVGERRSPTAIARGWTWESGRLCADTLHRALRAAGIEPSTECEFANLFRDDAPADWSPDLDALALVYRWYVLHGGLVVALGRRVAAVLERNGIPHRVLTHPAARGAIRKSCRYREHVAEVLGAARETTQPEVTR